MGIFYRKNLNARFHQLLSQNKCDKDDKKAIVMQVSNNEHQSTIDLSHEQLKEAIALLEADKTTSVKRMRAKAINMAKDLGFVPADIKTKEDWKGLNTWCENTFKKPFYMLSFDELRDCISGLDACKTTKANRQLKELLS